MYALHLLNEYHAERRKKLAAPRAEHAAPSSSTDQPTLPEPTAASPEKAVQAAEEDEEDDDEALNLPRSRRKRRRIVSSSSASSALTDVPSDAGYLSEIDKPLRLRRWKAHNEADGPEDMDEEDELADDDTIGNMVDGDSGDSQEQVRTPHEDTLDSIPVQENAHSKNRACRRSDWTLPKQVAQATPYETADTPLPSPTPTPPPERPPWEGGPLLIDQLEQLLSDTLMSNDMSLPEPDEDDDDGIRRRRIRKGSPRIVRAYGAPSARFASLSPPLSLCPIAFPQLFILLDPMPGKVMPSTHHPLEKDYLPLKKKPGKKKPAPEWTPCTFLPRRSVSSAMSEKVMSLQLKLLMIQHTSAVLHAEGQAVWDMPSNLRDVYAVTASKTLKIIKMHISESGAFTTAVVAEEPATSVGLQGIAGYIEHNVFNPEVVAQRIKYIDHWREVTDRPSEPTQLPTPSQSSGSSRSSPP